MVRRMQDPLALGGEKKSRRLSQPIIDCCHARCNLTLCNLLTATGIGPMIVKAPLQEGTSSMAEERRRACRFTIDQMVELELGKESVVHASGINLSSTGLLCKSDYFMEPGTEVSVVLTVPSASGSHTVSCDGIVIRTERGRGRHLTAIQFMTLAGKDVGALEAFLESCKPA